tara:strand:+ start:5559 stop:11639 length:6081 start_codon:yes stop_codon:yes gene_type:complete
MAIRLNGQIVGLDKSVQDAVNRINRRGGLNLNLNERSFTQPLGRITTKANEFTKSLEASNARVIAFGASVGILNGVREAFESLVTSVIKVEKALTDVNVVLNASSGDLRKFGDGLFKVARNTAQSFDTVAIAATEFARQGLSIEETLKRTNDALILTRLTGMDAAESVKNLTAAMNTFSKAGLTSTEIISKMASVDVEFAVSADDLAAAISRTGQAAISSGVSIDQLIGIVTAAQQRTARGGAVIGNSLKTIFTRIQRPDTLRQLEELGVAVRDVEFNTLPAIQILNNLASTYDTLSDAQKSQIGQTVAGVFQINILKAALADASSQNSILARATEISANATDEAISKNEKLNTTLSALASQTSISLLELSKSIGEIALAPGIKSVLNFVNGLAEGLTKLTKGEDVGSQFFQGFLKGIGKIATGPGLIIFIGVVLKLFQNATKFAVQSVRDILGIQTQAQKLKGIEESILTVLSRNSAIQKELIGLEGNRAAQERVVLELVKQQTAALAAQQTLAKNIAPGLARSGVQQDLSLAPTRRRRFAGGGYVSKGKTTKIPNFAAPTPGGAFGAFGKDVMQRVYGKTMNISKPLTRLKEDRNFIQVNQKSRQEESSLFKKGTKNIIDMTRTGIHMLLPSSQIGPRSYIAKVPPKVRVANSQAQSIIANSQIAFDATGLDPKAMKGKDASQKGATNKLQNMVLSSAASAATTWINSLGPNGAQEVISSRDLESDIKNNKYQGSKGALGALTGAAFEAGMNRAFSYKAATRESAGDFDLRGNIPKALKEVFNIPVGIPLILGDYKNAPTAGNLSSMAAKIAREIGASTNTQGFGGKPIKGLIAQGSAGEKSIIAAKGGVRRKSGGLIPNYSPLGNAIGREMAAGVPASAIRVGSSPMLMSSQNPSGLGVFNTIDEPRGLSQGIGRAMSEGRNPLTYGVPNFARDPIMSAMDIATDPRGNPRLQKAISENILALEEGRISLGEYNSANKKAAKAAGMSSTELRSFVTQTKMTRKQFRQAGLSVKSAGGRGMLGGQGLALGLGLPMASGLITQMGTNKETGQVNTGAAVAGGALQMGGTGALIGSMFAPGLGTAIGGAVGALVGGVTSFFSNESQNLKLEGEKIAAEAMARVQQFSSMANSLLSNVSLSEEQIDTVTSLLNDQNLSKDLDVRWEGKYQTRNIKQKSFRNVQAALAALPQDASALLNEGNRVIEVTVSDLRNRLNRQLELYDDATRRLANPNLRDKPKQIQEGIRDESINLAQQAGEAIANLLIAQSNARESLEKQAGEFLSQAQILQNINSRMVKLKVIGIMEKGTLEQIEMVSANLIKNQRALGTDTISGVTKNRLEAEQRKIQEARRDLVRKNQEQDLKILKDIVSGTSDAGKLAGDRMRRDIIPKMMETMSASEVLQSLTDPFGKLSPFYGGNSLGVTNTPQFQESIRKSQIEAAQTAQAEADQKIKLLEIAKKQILTEADISTLKLAIKQSSQEINTTLTASLAAQRQNLSIEQSIGQAEQNYLRSLEAITNVTSTRDTIRRDIEQEQRKLADDLKSKNQQLSQSNIRALIGLGDNLTAPAKALFQERILELQKQNKLTESNVAQELSILQFKQGEAQTLQLTLNSQKQSRQLIAQQNDADKKLLAMKLENLLLEDEARRTVAAGRSRALEGIQTNIQNLGSQIGEGTTTSFLNNLERGLADVASGAKSARDAFSSFAFGIVQDIQKILQQNIASNITNAIFNTSGAQAVQSGIASVFQARKSGGMINKYSGGGGVPSIVQGGEFLFSKEATSRIGAGNLMAMNSLSVPKFNSGGRVSARLISNPDPEMAAVFGLMDEKERRDAEYDKAIKQWKKARRRAVFSTIANTFLSAATSEFIGPNGRLRGIEGVTQFTGSVGHSKGPSISDTLPGKARGGMIRGGSGVKDDIPTVLQGGEFVMRKSAVQKYGASFMDRLNRGMNEGGPVGMSTPKTPAIQSDSGANVSININVNGEGSSDSETNVSNENSSKNKEFANKIKSVVLQVIKDEQRVGGTLSKKNPDQ